MQVIKLVAKKTPYKLIVGCYSGIYNQRFKPWVISAVENFSFQNKTNKIRQYLATTLNITPQMLRIGTRNSTLALWQAETVQQILIQYGAQSELVHIQSAGDVTQDIPLHQMGGIGIFTKALDDALLNNEIDCAVHSCKDLPSTLHESLCIAAHLKREDPRDILVCKTEPDIFLKENYDAVIATGSVRRKAQWLSKFPSHRIEDLRGNVQTRLKKLHDNTWDAAIFAYAGLKRLNIQPEKYYFPEWLLPAPAQGVVAVVCKKDDADTRKIFASVNHLDTALTTTVERDFLRLMEGGCIAPIGALATIHDNNITLGCSVLNENGSEKVAFEMQSSVKDYANLGGRAYETAAALGAVEIIKTLKPLQ